MAAALGDPLRKLAAEVRGVPKAAMLDAVKAVKKIADEEARRDVGADGAMSHMGYRKAKGEATKTHKAVKLVLRDNYTERMNQSSVRLSGGGVTGAWKLINAGADVHEIGKTTTRGARKGQARLLSIGNRVVRGPVTHPGMKGKGTFDRVVKRAQVEVPKVAELALAKAVAKTMKG